MPRISVCMLAYNHAHLMRPSLDNLLAQSFEDFELIISDDCGPDPNMEPICRAYEQQDSRVKYFRNARNLGRIANYNAAVSHATGEYIAIVHDGDRFRNDMLQKWVEALDTYPQAAFVFNSSEKIDWDGTHIKYHYHDYPPLIPGRDLVDEMLGRPDSPVSGMTMFRKAALEAVGPFDERFNIIGDVDVWLRMAMQYDVAYVREPLFARVPREKNHDTSERCWDTLQEGENILSVNARRRHADDPAALAQALARIEQISHPRWTRQLLVCVKDRRGKLLREGIRRARARNHRDLNLLRLALTPVASLLPKR